MQWLNAKGQAEAQFFVLADAAEIDAVIRIYREIRETRSPVSFVFVESEREGSYDVFRFSARSYLEHHNQIKPPVAPRDAVRDRP